MKNSSTSSLSSSDMSLSSSINVDCRDSDALLTPKKKRRRKSLECDEASEKILYTTKCDSHREKHCHCPTKFDNQVFKYPHEECFSLKKLPR